MADRVAKLVLTFDGEAGTIDSVLAQIKGSVRNAVADLERTTSKVELFGQLQDNLPKIQAAIDRNTAAAVGFRAEIDRVTASGGKVTDDLTKGLAASEKASSSARAEFARQTAQIASLNSSLKAAGVDTSNLAAAQIKLTAATRDAAAAAELQAAKQTLNVKTLADIQPQIAKINAAYLTLRDSGKLSATEIAAAQQQATLRTKELTGQVTTAATAFGGLQTSVASFLTSTLGRFLSVTAAAAALTEAISASIAASKAYLQGVAEIGTISNLTKAELDALGKGVRELAQSLGFDLQAGLKATFDLVRSGVAPGNALDVLAISAEAAKAGLTDIGTTAKISNILLSGFGHTVGDLRGDFDALIKGSKDGGATLKEFAESGAPLANVARALRIDFNELVAILTVMTNASNDAAGSQAALLKVLLKIGDSDTRAKLRELGIESNNFLEILTQLGEKHKGLEDIIALGIASSKTAAGVAALTNNTSKLPAELDAINDSAGIVKKTTEGLFDSPRERSERFNAALEETKVKIGLLVGSGSLIASFGTGFLQVINNSVAATGDLDTQLAAAAAGANLLADSGDVLSSNLDQADRALQRVSASAEDSTRKIDAANKVISESAAALSREIQALQAASVGDVTDINARADAQIAALDRTTKAQAATAAATIAIQIKAADDVLAVIIKSEKAINAAVDASAADQKKSAAEVTKIRLDALAPIIAQYQAHYKALTALQQQHVANINALEQGRVAFNQSVEDQLFQIRLAGLSVFDQYVAKVNEVERLTALARKQGADGFIADATATTNKAIALALSLGKVVNESGTTIVGKYEAQGKALAAVNVLQKNLNENITAQEGKEKSAADALGERIKTVTTTLTELQTKYDELKATIAEGLEIKVRFDERSIADAKAQIDELVKARVVPITVDVSGSTVPAGGGLASGGLVQRFAGGGSVFRPPSWSKVPGSGDGDTVPAALPLGSFVLRKAASQYYGDALLGKLARGYATGGYISQFSNPVTGSVITAFGGSTQSLAKIVDYGGLIPALAPTSYEKFFASNQQGSAYIGDVQSGTTESVRDVGQIAPPKLPTDRNELIRKVLEYANSVVVAANPERYVFDRAITELNAWLKQFDRDQNTDTLLQALQTARAIGLNLGISTGRLFGFDVDGRKWHKEQVFGGFGALGFSPGAASYNFYAKGGGVDTVPAWLTPGEHVMQPRAVEKYGGGFMQALNQMQIPKGHLDNILNFPVPRPASVARFAEGGPVGYTQAQGRPSAASMAGTINLTINVQKLDESTIYNTVIPTLRRALKRSA